MRQFGFISWVDDVKWFPSRVPKALALRRSKWKWTSLTKLVKHVWLNIFLEYPDVVITVLPALLVPQTYSMTNFVDDGSHEFTTRTYWNFLFPSCPTHVRPASENKWSWLGKRRTLKPILVLEHGLVPGAFFFIHRNGMPILWNSSCSIS